jgi:hypothetical protein
VNNILYLPTEDTEEQLILSVQALSSLIGKQLYDFFQSQFEPIMKESWLGVFQLDPTDTLANPKDLHFLLCEMIYKRESPLRRVTPF